MLHNILEWSITKVYLPGDKLTERILDALGMEKAITLFVPCIMVKKSLVFPLLFGLGYIKRSKCRENFSTY